MRSPSANRLTVACLWVRGHVPFSADYVVRLRNMAERYCPEHDFVCLTDQAKKLPASLETVRVDTPPRDLFGWWKKLELFRAVRLDVGRVLYLDLDTLIVAPLDPVIDYHATFALVPTEGTFAGRHGLAVVKLFNSSAMVWDGGTLRALWDDWTPAVARRLWGDQDWIGERMPDSRTFPLQWFPRLSSIPESGRLPAEAKVVLCKKPKNEEAAKRWPWFAERWI